MQGVQVFVLLGEGYQFPSYLSQQCKYLAKLGDRRLVDFVLSDVRNELPEAKVTVVVRDSDATVVQTHLTAQWPQVQVAVDHGEYGATAKLVADLVQPGDYCLVLPGDLFGQVGLKSLLDKVKEQKAIAGMVYQSKLPHEEFTVSSSSSPSLLGLLQEQLVVMESVNELKESGARKLEIANNYVGSVTLKMNAYDLGVYVLDIAVLTKLCSKQYQAYWEDTVGIPAPLNIKQELLPLITRTSNSAMFTMLQEDDWQDQVSALSLSSDAVLNNNPRPVLGIEADKDKAICRVNALGPFLYATQVLTHPVAQILSRSLPEHLHMKAQQLDRPKGFKDSLLSTAGDWSSWIEGKSTASRSQFVGSVKIGTQCKISSSVIGNGVVIGKACKINRSYIADGTEVPSNTTLNDAAILEQMDLEEP